MANTLNGLVPALYEALDVISREMTGFIPAVSRDSSVARAAIGQDVLVPITSEAASADNTPGVTAPDSGDTGTVLAGDIATFDADTGNKYVVGTGVAAPGTITLNKPGSQILIPTANALTLGGSYTANVAFARSAIVLATRAPAMPEGGDSADDVITITDPLTGLSFEIAVYRQFLQTAYHVRLAWGCRAIKDEHRRPRGWCRCQSLRLRPSSTMPCRDFQNERPNYP